MEYLTTRFSAPLQDILQLNGRIFLTLLTKEFKIPKGAPDFNQISIPSIWL